MRHPYKTLPRTLLLALSSALALASIGQDKFTVNGRLKIEGSDLSGARVVVYKNGEKERSVTQGLSKFSLDLDLDASYILSFEKNGHVTKKLSFNTKVPEGSVQAFRPFDFAVSLFKQYDDVNIVVFNQPVGVIRYERSIGDFDYDTDYTKSIQSQLQQALAEVEKKRKEEEQAASANAKQEAADAKARAKAEAEAKKQAQAEEKAAKAREEAARKEEEKRRAEEERVAEAAQKEKVPPPPPATEKPAPAPAPAPVAKQVPEKPAPVAKREAPVRPEPAPRPVSRNQNTVMARAVEGQDGRRSTNAMMEEEASRMAVARTAAAEESRPTREEDLPHTVRNEDLVVEPNQVTTIVRLETRGVMTEYRRVAHKWGGVFFFKNGETTTEQVYQREAMGEDRMLAGATPRAN